MHSPYALHPHQSMLSSSTSTDPRNHYLSSSSPATTSGHSSIQDQRSPPSIGQPISFTTGAYLGKTIRMELLEIQKADLGRKYAKVDRRPLDPPPVVRLRIFDVQTDHLGRQHEVELTYDESLTLGLLCTVDLFPAPTADVLSGPGLYGHENSDHAAVPSSSSSSSSRTQFRHYRYNPGEGGAAHPSQPFSAACNMYPVEGSPDIVHHFNGVPITERSKQTQALVGAKFVQPTIFEYQGDKAIVFVFADLAVKMEGIYFLRYRVFDLFGKVDDDKLVVAAETYGGSFKVYSTKEFPGLSASTELTKLLARWGVRLNIRETERKRRKRPSTRKDQDSDSEQDD